MYFCLLSYGFLRIIFKKHDLKGGKPLRKTFHRQEWYGTNSFVFLEIFFHVNISFVQITKKVFTGSNRWTLKKH